MYISGLLRGNLGESMAYRQPVVSVIAGALPWTLLVLSISLFVSFLIGVLVGMFIAWKRKTILDPVVSVYASIFGSIPNYIIALILIIIFAVNLRWFPTKGRTTRRHTGVQLAVHIQRAKACCAAHHAYVITDVAAGRCHGAPSVSWVKTTQLLPELGPDRRIITTYVWQKRSCPW